MTMTAPKDSAAIKAANTALDDFETSVDDLKAAQAGIRDEIRRMEQSPSIDLATATSLEQRRAMEAEKEARSAEGEILHRLFSLLGTAIQRRRAQDAIESAEDDRQALSKALEMAERARRAADSAAADALALADGIREGRAAAGNPGRRVVGATGEQLDRLLHLADRAELMNDVERKRLRLHVELDEPQAQAS